MFGFVLCCAVVAFLALACFFLFRWRAQDRDFYAEDQEFYPEDQAIDLGKLITQRSFRPTIMVIEGRGRTHRGYELVEVLGLNDNGMVPLVESQIRATDENGSYDALYIRVAIRYVRIGEIQYEDDTIVPHNVPVWWPTPEDEVRAHERIERANKHVQNVRRRYLA